VQQSAAVLIKYLVKKTVLMQFCQRHAQAAGGVFEILRLTDFDAVAHR